MNSKHTPNPNIPKNNIHSSHIKVYHLMLFLQVLDHSITKYNFFEGFLYLFISALFFHKTGITP